MTTAINANMLAHLKAAGSMVRLAACWSLRALVLFSGAVHAAESWPSPHLPDGLETFAIGQEMRVNGLPMRLRGFVSPRATAELLQALRMSLGNPLVEDTSGSAHVLGRAEGNHYISVRIEGTPSGSRGTVAVTDLGTASKRYSQHRNNLARWLDRLPAGSTITSDLVSEEDGREAQHLVFVNRQGAGRNRDGLVALLKNDGFRLEREVSDGATFGAGAGTLYFAAPGKEAMAVIARSADITSVVLNIVTMTAAVK